MHAVSKSFHFISMASSSQYDVQLRIRQEAEERSAAHQDLASWIDCVANQRHENGADAERTVLSTASFNRYGQWVPKIASIDHDQCNDERLRGNDFFVQGKYQEAIACYSRCLGNKDALASPLVYSNRGKKMHQNILQCCIIIAILTSTQPWHT